MRYLEVRRHSLTKKGEARGRGSELSQEGVTAARVVGSQMGPFAFVAVSTASRTAETAMAMGFAIDEVLDIGSGYIAGGLAHHDQWQWERPYVRYRELIASQEAMTSAVAKELELWLSVAAGIPDEASALVVSHGGIIEPTLVGALPDAEHADWGGPFAHLDGARLTWDGGMFTNLAFHRYRPASS